MENTGKKSLFKADAKQLVDTLFDNKLFHESVTRDDMNTVEDLVEFMMNSRYESHKKAEELGQKIREYEKTNP